MLFYNLFLDTFAQKFLLHLLELLLVLQTRFFLLFGVLNSVLQCSSCVVGLAYSDLRFFSERQFGVGFQFRVSSLHFVWCVSRVVCEQVGVVVVVPAHA